MPATTERAEETNSGGGGDFLQIPSFSEYVARMNSSNDPLNEAYPATASTSTTSKRVPVRSYESFSKGIDALNR